MILHDNGFKIPIKHNIKLALFVTIAIVLHTIESLLPLPIPIPGIKLGLANIVSLLVIIIYNWKSTFYVVTLRVVLGSLINGSFLGLTFLMSLAGGIISAMLMYIVYKNFCPPFSIVGVSIIGAIVHCFVQICVATIVVVNLSLMWYIPYMLLLAAPTGLVTGIIIQIILKKISIIRF